MRPLLSLAIAFVIAGGVQSASAQPAPPDRPVVVTTGEGIVKRAPDRAWLMVSAETRARSPRDAQRANAEAMSNVVQKLRSASLPADAVRTASYDVQPEFDYNNGRQTLRGYVARNAIEVRLDEVARVGEILDLVVGSGATSVSGVRFDLKDRDAAEREALRLAVADAKARAEAAASGAGVRIDQIVRIEEQRGFAPEPRPMMAYARAERAVEAETPVSAGDVEVRARVMLTAGIR